MLSDVVFDKEGDNAVCVVAEDDDEYNDCLLVIDAAALLTARTDVLCRSVLKKLDGPERGVGDGLAAPVEAVE